MENRIGPASILNNPVLLGPPTRCLLNPGSPTKIDKTETTNIGYQLLLTSQIWRIPYKNRQNRKKLVPLILTSPLEDFVSHRGRFLRSFGTCRQELYENLSRKALGALKNLVGEGEPF